MSIQKGFLKRSNDWLREKQEGETLVLSIPGQDGNVYPPPIPSTGEVPFFSPGDSENAIGEVMNTAGKKLPVPNVIATDGTQIVT